MGMRRLSPASARRAEAGAAGLEGVAGDATLLGLGNLNT
jgi:hypothetical protein